MTQFSLENYKIKNLLFFEDLKNICENDKIDEYKLWKLKDDDHFISFYFIKSNPEKSKKILEYLSKICSDFNKLLFQHYLIKNNLENFLTKYLKKFKNKFDKEHTQFIKDNLKNNGTCLENFKYVSMFFSKQFQERLEILKK